MASTGINLGEAFAPRMGSDNLAPQISQIGDVVANELEKAGLRKRAEKAKQEEERRGNLSKYKVDINAAPVDAENYKDFMQTSMTEYVAGSHSKDPAIRVAADLKMRKDLAQAAAMKSHYENNLTDMATHHKVMQSNNFEEDKGFAPIMTEYKNADYPTQLKMLRDNNAATLSDLHEQHTNSIEGDSYRAVKDFNGGKDIIPGNTPETTSLPNEKGVVTKTKHFVPYKDYYPSKDENGNIVNAKKENEFVNSMNHNALQNSKDAILVRRKVEREARNYSNNIVGTEEQKQRAYEIHRDETYRDMFRKSVEAGEQELRKNPIFEQKLDKENNKLADTSGYTEGKTSDTVVNSEREDYKNRRIEGHANDILRAKGYTDVAPPKPVKPIPIAQPNKIQRDQNAKDNDKYERDLTTYNNYKSAKESAYEVAGSPEAIKSYNDSFDKATKDNPAYSKATGEEENVYSWKNESQEEALTLTNGKGGKGKINGVKTDKEGNPIAVTANVIQKVQNDNGTDKEYVQVHLPPTEENLKAAKTAMKEAGGNIDKVKWDKSASHSNETKSIDGHSYTFEEVKRMAKEKGKSDKEAEALWQKLQK